MEKELTINQIEEFYNVFEYFWREKIQDIKLNTRALYNLISFKKKIGEQHAIVQETIIEMMKKAGATETENGGLKVPDDKVAEINKEFAEFGKEKVKFEINEIKIGETDSMPPELIEILFDFIVFE